MIVSYNRRIVCFFSGFYGDTVPRNAERKRTLFPGVRHMHRPGAGQPGPVVLADRIILLATPHQVRATRGRDRHVARGAIYLGSIDGCECAACGARFSSRWRPERCCQYRLGIPSFWRRTQTVATCRSSRAAISVSDAVPKRTSSSEVHGRRLRLCR